MARSSSTGISFKAYPKSENDDNIQIEQSEIKLLGVVSSDIDITPDNIIL